MLFVCSVLVEGSHRVFQKQMKPFILVAMTRNLKQYQIRDSRKSYFIFL